jgi:transcriptional regulator with XRE-family HTH domain
LLGWPTRKDGSPVAHALAAFIRERMDEKGWRNADLVRESELSRQVVSKLVNDNRESITRLPERKTLEGLAKGLGVSLDFLIGKAVESLGIGYTAGDFVNAVATASDRELLDEIARRLTERGGEHADGSAPKTDAGGPGNLPDLGAGRRAREERLRRDALPGQIAAYEGDAVDDD